MFNQGEIVTVFLLPYFHSCVFFCFLPKTKIMSPNTALVNIKVQIFEVDGPGTFFVHYEQNIFYILCCTIQTLLNEFCLFSIFSG